MTWDQVLAKITECIEKINDKFNALVERVNSVLDKVPGWAERLLAGFNEAWEKMCDKVAELWTWLGDRLAYAGDPFLLRDTITAWHNEVGLPTEREAKKVEEDPDLLVDDTDRWGGTAALAYRSKVGPQKEAIEAVGESYVTPIVNALSVAKWGVISFWVAILLALGSLVFAFALACISAGTIIGALASPEFLIGGIGAFFISATAGTVALIATMANAETSLDNISMYFADGWPDFALN